MQGFATRPPLKMSTIVPRGSRSRLVPEAGRGHWIDAHDNVILSGPTGVGKSWLACALAIGLAATTDPFSISAFPSSSRISRWRAAMAAMPDSCGRLGACNSSSLMTGASNLSMPLHGTICSKFSKNATGEDRQSSPASSQSTNGTTLSAIRLTPTPFSTASSTMPTASISQATAFALTAQSTPKTIDHPRQAMSQLQQPARPAPWATSCRNPRAASSRNARAAHRNRHAAGCAEPFDAQIFIRALPPDACDRGAELKKLDP